MAWFDDSLADLKYAIKAGGAWTISDVDTQGDVGRFPSLVLDQQDNPAVSYFQWDSGRTGSIKFARWNGSEWDTQSVGELSNVVIGHFGARKISSLVLDKNDNPIIAFSDEDIIKLAWWDGSEWQVETVLTAEGTPLGQQVSLALDNDGVLHLTFADAAGKRPPGVTGVIFYAMGTPAME